MVLFHWSRHVVCGTLSNTASARIWEGDQWKLPNRLGSGPFGMPVKLKFSCGTIGELGSYGCFCGLGMTFSQFSPVSP